MGSLPSCCFSAFGAADEWCRFQNWSATVAVPDVGETIWVHTDYQGKCNVADLQRSRTLPSNATSVLSLLYLGIGR